MKKKLLLTLSLILAISISALLAQHKPEKCATMTILNAQIAKDPSILLKMQQAEKITQKWLLNNAGRETKQVITIPVVFHIIHNGEPIGEGNNVSDDLVMYQLKRINEDFRKLNADTLLPDHPFYPLQADCEIEFCLAKRTPSGDPTTGINRYEMGQASWTQGAVDHYVKPGTIWDRNKYLNFWCVNVVDPDVPGLDGYATFPTETSDSTDGIVVIPSSFGYVNGTDKSITATHELGHYFNLRHIWGDGECASDSIADTPPAEKSNEGCPTFPYNVNGPCDPGVNGEMFMNYMDYSAAECVVMYTYGQKDRMLSAIATFRSSLIGSNGCEPTVATNEAFNYNSLNFTVSPNPSRGIFQINLLSPNKAVGIILYNQLGSIVKQFDSVSDFPYSVNAAELPSGLYFLKIKSDNNTQTQKLVISK